MPTARPRYQITETPDVSRALDLAAQRWPHESRAKLLLRLVQAGSSALAGERANAVHARLSAIDASSGTYRGVFGEDYLADIRRDWPE